MSCLMKFKWVKLPREIIPEKKGIMGYWMKLASRVAFRKGNSFYCGHTNEVNPGEWVGGIIGLKSILRVKTKEKALIIMDELVTLGYINYNLDEQTRKLTYKINDWVLECSGQDCFNDNVYATNDYGFLCVPRSITERLVNNRYKFSESDAWLDLWIHTIYEDKKNFLTFFAPMVRFQELNVFLSLETLSKRWGWEKTKTWRFFQKNKEVFELYRLPGTYGCLLFNRLYPVGKDIVLPKQSKIIEVILKIRQALEDKNIDCAHGSLGNLIEILQEDLTGIIINEKEKNSVALSHYIICAYISPCRKGIKIIYDCKGYYILLKSNIIELKKIRGPCVSLDLRIRRNIMAKKKEIQVSPEAREMINLFVRGGLLANAEIADQKIRDFKQKKNRDLFHNTGVLLNLYRKLSWILICFPENVAAELDIPFKDIDHLIERLDVEWSYGNKVIDNRMEGLMKTRMIIDKINNAVEMQKGNPDGGMKIYQLLYLQFIAPEKLTTSEIAYRLDVSERQYFRLKKKAITAISNILWGSNKEVDFWIEIISILDK